MLAPAKINLDLLITGRRDDGYHLLDSIVVFTELGDELTVEKSDQLSLTISGPFANDLSSENDNLILEAARLICLECGVEPNLKFHLVKNLPVSSGIGGGSADAAAAIKLTIQQLNLSVSKERLETIAIKLGADVPVCLRSISTHMRGIGEDLSPLILSRSFDILLVNPGVSVSTPRIFNEYKKFEKKFDRPRKEKVSHINDGFIKEEVLNSQNALESVACRIEPQIQIILKTLENFEGLWLGRMSGSGATCFGIFNNEENCLKAKKYLKTHHSKWWIESTKSV